MESVVTGWRQAVMDQIEANLTDANGGAFEVIAGERDGVSRDRNLACVFEIDSPTDGNPSFMRPILIVRAWLRTPKTTKTQIPIDPQPLEQLKQDLAELLQQIQVLPAIGIWGLYFQVIGRRTDFEDRGVEFTLQGWTGNPAAIPVGA
jgi:hypothetical protein